jgi:hypothetical protein
MLLFASLPSIHHLWSLEISPGGFLADGTWTRLRTSLVVQQTMIREDGWGFLWVTELKRCF